jgi:hypothetical protein
MAKALYSYWVSNDPEMPGAVRTTTKDNVIRVLSFFSAGCSYFKYTWGSREDIVSSLWQDRDVNVCPSVALLLHSSSQIHFSRNEMEFKKVHLGSVGFSKDTKDELVTHLATYYDGKLTHSILIFTLLPSSRSRAEEKCDRSTRCDETSQDLNGLCSRCNSRNGSLSQCLSRDRRWCSEVPSVFSRRDRSRSICRVGWTHSRRQVTMKKRREETESYSLPI